MKSGKLIKFTIITKEEYIVRGNSTKIIEINTDIIHYKTGVESVASGQIKMTPLYLTPKNVLIPSPC